MIDVLGLHFGRNARQLVVWPDPIVLLVRVQSPHVQPFVPRIGNIVVQFLVAQLRLSFFGGSRSVSFNVGSDQLGVELRTKLELYLEIRVGPQTEADSDSRIRTCQIKELNTNWTRMKVKGNRIR